MDFAWSIFHFPKMGLLESAASPKAPKCTSKSAIANVSRTSPARKYLRIPLSSPIGLFGESIIRLPQVSFGKTGLSVMVGTAKGC
jgi:hypothetical protein